MALQKKKSVKLTVADLLAFAGVDLTVTGVDLSGTDDGNVCTLHGTDKDGDEAQITFSRLAYDHGPEDIGGASCGLLKSAGGKYLLAGLPELEKADLHGDGRACDHATARIKVARDAMDAKTPVVLAWVE